MDRSDTIARLRGASDRLHRAGIRALYLFGSLARDEAGPASDVDLFVDPDCARFGLVELLRTGEMPSAEPGRPVYPTTREGLHLIPRAEIERAAIGVL